MQGSDFYYKYLSGEMYEDWKAEEIVPMDWNAKKGAIKFLNNHNIDGEEELRDSIVFMNHQGYIYQFIKTNEGADPPVYILDYRNTGMAVRHEYGRVLLANTFCKC